MCNKKWKQKLSIAMAAILVCGGGITLPVTAYAAEESVNIQQEIAPQEEALPAEEAAVPVTEEEPLAREDLITLRPDKTERIESNAYRNRPDILEVIIPEGVKSIGSQAFYGCSNLVRVVLPESLEVIEGGAFEHCSSLKDINIPKNVSALPRYIFHECESLKSIEIPEGVTDIGEDAFSYCMNLESVALSSTVKNIGERAFSNCTNLKGIAIPEGVTEILRGTFYYCQNLESVTLPESLTAIEPIAFYECNALSGIELKGNLSTIGNSAFSGCRALENIVLPKSVATIGNTAFCECEKLQSFVIEPDSVLETVGDSAFGYCGELKSFIIPGGVARIGDGAFRGCSGLECMVIPGNVNAVSGSMFNGCRNLKSVVVRNGVQGIGTWAFSGCENLLYVAVPESVLLLQPGSIPNNNKNLTMLVTQGSYGEGYAKDNDIAYQYYSEGQEEFLINCAEDLSALAIAEETEDNLELPTVGAKHASAIRWESDNSDVISIGTQTAGQPVTAVAHRGEKDATATLTASVSYESVTLTKKFLVSVKNDWAGWAVKEDAEALFLPGKATENLELPRYGTERYCDIHWTSSHPNVISESGEVTRAAQDVTVTLTAEISRDYAKTTKTFKVIVPKDPSIADAEAAAKAKAKAEAAKALRSIQAPAAKTLYTGSVSHTATIALTYPNNFTAKLNAAGLSRKSVTYRSDKPATASVNSQGKVTGLKAGKATITTTVTLSDGQKKTLKTAITVKKPYLKISGKNSVKRGKTLTLKANRYGIARSAACTWSVDKAKFATISKKTGKLKAKKAGAVTVTVKAGTVKASYKVKIKK